MKHQVREIYAGTDRHAHVSEAHFLHSGIYQPSEETIPGYEVPMYTHWSEIVEGPTGNAINK